ncbi:hypothetical protein BD309DRAFT_511651 [Dichomitus squalens]|nr:hypothetical protein BD309DRAFT_511651 [Dichomitus squalens]
MRGQSIPGWAFLKEPSASSGAPSKDKHPTQRSQLTQESPVQSAVSSNAMGPPPSPGPSSKHNLGGGKSGGHYGTRPNRPVSGGPPPPARARRPHSGTDEEEEQPKKKKKRLLVNATPSSSRTAVLPAGASRSATYEKHLLKQPPSSAPAGTSRDAASQNRRATMDTGQLSRMRAQRIVERLNPHPGVKQKQANRSGPTTSRVPSSSLRGPLAGSSKPAIGSRVPSSSLRSQPPLAGPFKPIIGSRGPQQGSRFSSSSRAAPDKSGSATQRPLSTQRRKSAISQYDVIDISDEVDEQAAPRAARQTSRRASAPAAPPDEIIEILDSDEEAQMLSSRSRNTSRDEKPESSQQSTLPRRRAPAPARYKEVDGCIILESSDDDEPPTSSQVPLKKPSSTARRTSPVQRNASEPSSRPMAHTQEQPSDVQIPVPPPEQRPSLVATPPPLDDMEMVDSPPAMFEVPEPSAAVDFEMADGASQAAGSEVRPERGSESQVALAPEDITPATPSSPSHEEQPEAEDLVESNQPLTEPSEAPISMELVTEEGTTPDGTPTLCSTSPSEAGMQPVPELSDPSGSDLAQDPNSLASTPPLPHIAGLRADTASPVSTVLDPGLQNLVISGTPPGSSGSAENVQSPSEGSTATQSSSRRSSSRTRSLRPSDRVPWKMRGAVHDGSTGWIRGALKKRSELQYRLQGTGKSSPLVSPGGDTSAGSPTFSTNALADTSLSELPKDTCVSTAAVHETQKGPVEDVQLSAVVSTSRLDEASGLHQVIDPEVVEGEAAIPEPQSSLPQPTPVVPSVEPTPSVATAEIEKLEIHRPGTQPSTPPLENSLPQPLGPTLSQVIRDAANQNARKNVIDLTFDKSDDDRAAEAAGNPAEKSSESRGEVPPFTRPRDVQVTPATAVQVAVTALSTTSPSTVDRLSPIKPTNAPQLQQPSPSKTTTPSQPEQPSSLKLSFPPLPRNVRRPSAPDALRSPPAESAAIDSNSQASAQETALPAAIPKPRLPRRDVIRNMQTASSSSIGSSAPSLVSFASTATHAATDVPEIEMVVVEAAPSVPARNRLLASDIRPHTAISPSGSGSPSTDTTGEEGRSLLYPSSTPEASPEAEVRACCLLQ